MTKASVDLNNLWEAAATPQQCLGNALVTNIPEQSTDKLWRLFTTSIAPDRQNEAKNRQNTNKREKLITQGRVYKTASQISALRHPT